MVKAKRKGEQDIVAKLKETTPTHSKVATDQELVPEKLSAVLEDLQSRTFKDNKEAITAVVDHMINIGGPSPDPESLQEAREAMLLVIETDPVLRDEILAELRIK